jgi:hypothetical protein
MQKKVGFGRKRRLVAGLCVAPPIGFALKQDGKDSRISPFFFYHSEHICYFLL